MTRDNVTRRHARKVNYYYPIPADNKFALRYILTTKAVSFILNTPIHASKYASQHVQMVSTLRTENRCSRHQLSKHHWRMFSRVYTKSGTSTETKHKVLIWRNMLCTHDKSAFIYIIKIHNKETPVIARTLGVPTVIQYVYSLGQETSP